MKKRDIEFEKLEKEFEAIVGNDRPINTWVPYKKVVKSTKSVKDPFIQQLEDDLEKQIEIDKRKEAIKNYKTTNNFRLLLQSNYMMKNKLGEIVNYKPNKKVQMNGSNNKIVSKSLFDEYKKLNEKYKTKYNQGNSTILKITFSGEDGDGNKSLYSISIKNTNLTENGIYKKIKKDVIEKFLFGDSGAIVNLYSVSFYTFGLSDAGGCGTCKKTVEKFKYKNRTVKLISPKSTNNNCLFLCFCYFLNIKGNSLNLDNVRKEIGLESGMINFKDVVKVADYFKTGFILLNEKQEVILTKDLKDKPKVHIMLMNSHYYIVEYVEYNKCDKCGKKLLSSNTNHQCSNKMITYYKKQVLKQNEYVDMIDCSDKKKIQMDEMIFFDLETFQEKVSHIPYACGFSFGNHKDVDISYGKNCMDKFINHLLTVKNKTICAYNGSGFDFFMLINELQDKNIAIENLVLSNGCILSFTFGKNNKVFDLYRFIMSNLDKACDAYKIKNHKMKFDVLKIQSWELAEKYRNEVEPYLKFDVLSLSELFFTFNDFMYEYDSVNITKYTTLSHMAYSLWKKSLKDLIEIPSLDKYDFIKRGTYGARTYPNQKKFKSKYYNEVINKKMTYQELKKTLEYIVNADASSLYPASMAGFELLQVKVKYPTGKSRWSDNPKVEFDNNTIGMYEINFTCPKHIIIPILPRKTLNGGLEWSLVDGTGVYTNVEIKNAISIGYKIEFINKCLVWDTSSSEVFKPYVDRYYQMKTDAETEKNKVKRSVAKLLLNAMYGKTLQRAIFENTKIINNYDNLLEFHKNYDITDFSMLNENRILITGEVKNEQKEKCITKPCQLGAFVLSYSREIMLNYMKAIDPTLKSHIFTYTDTDSLHILGEHAEKLEKMGMIKTKDKASLGYLCSDIDNEGVIIYENNLAPKTYFYEYIDNKNDVYDKDNGTMKGKGIPKKCLKPDMYDTYKDNNEPVEFSGLRRKHKNLTKKDLDNGVKHFSIVNNTQKRTFMKSDWTGMDLIDNKYYPKGYIFSK